MRGRVRKEEETQRNKENYGKGEEKMAERGGKVKGNVMGGEEK